MMKVIVERCGRGDEDEFLVCVEGTDIEELTSPAGRKLAAKTAIEKFHLASVAHSGNSGPYVPNEKGEPAESAEDIDRIIQQRMLKGDRTNRWRVDFRVRSSIL